MMTTNRFLEGAFASVDKERSAFDLSVTGRIPLELNGRYLRNGRAEWYRNRWVRSKDVAAAPDKRTRGGDSCQSSLLPAYD
jgi:carotenoid cleavage dioxygenase-like enzyme